MPLYIDVHEPQEIIDKLKKRHLDVVVQKIDSGDYVFGDVAIERKTSSNLWSSLVKKTKTGSELWSQLEKLKLTYKQPMLLIEGGIDWYDPIESGCMTTLYLFWHFQILHSASSSETALIVSRLFTRYGTGRSGRMPPAGVIRRRTPKEVKWAMLQCVAGIGPKAASKILEAMPDIFSACYCYPLKILSEIKGLNKESIKILAEVLKG